MEDNEISKKVTDLISTSIMMKLHNMLLIITIMKSFIWHIAFATCSIFLIDKLILTESTKNLIVVIVFAISINTGLSSAISAIQKIVKLSNSAIKDIGSTK